jgi:hypothetical protein
LIIQVQEASRTPCRLDQNRSSPHQIIIKTSSIENRKNIEGYKREQTTYEDKPIKKTAHFSTETLKARRTWSKVFQALKKKFNHRILYPAKLSFKIDVGIKVFHDKQKQTIYDHQATTTEDSARNSTHR